jgi:hypothetical protein
MSDTLTTVALGQDSLSMITLKTIKLETNQGKKKIPRNLAGIYNSWKKIKFSDKVGT